MRSSPRQTHMLTRGTYACVAPPSTYARTRTRTHTAHTHIRSVWLERSLRITSWSMPSPTEVVNAIEPDLSPRTTTLGCLSTTALGCASSVAGASSTAGAAATAAATAAGACAAGTSSSGGPSSGAAESALVAAALASTARSAAVGLDGGTGPDAHASCASNCFTCSQTCAIAQWALGACRHGVPGGRRRAPRSQGRAGACAAPGRRRLRLLGGAGSRAVL